jgi:hypothetical protein
MVFLYGCDGRLTSKNGGSRPGQTWIHATEALDGPGLGMSFWSKEGGVLEITIEKNQTEACATDIAAAPLRSPTRLKQLLFAATVRCVCPGFHDAAAEPVRTGRMLATTHSFADPAASGGGLRLPGAALSGALLRHTRRFSPVVCGEAAFDAYRAAEGYAPAAGATGWLRKGQGSSFPSKTVKPLVIPGVSPLNHW